MKDQDWVGNRNSIFKTLGASNLTDKEREVDDYYATDPIAITVLCDVEKFNHKIWEPSCGEGHLSKRLLSYGYSVLSSDKVYRGYGDGNMNFLDIHTKWDGDIITNPPYKHAQEFIEKALSLIPQGNKVAMFLKLQFLEGKKRKKMFAKYPPKTVYVSSSRILCAKNADFEGMRKGGGSAVAFAWFVWVKGFEGNPIIKWVN